MWFSLKRWSWQKSASFHEVEIVVFSLDVLSKSSIKFCLVNSFGVCSESQQKTVLFLISQVFLAIKSISPSLSGSSFDIFVKVFNEFRLHLHSIIGVQSQTSSRARIL